MPIILSLLFAVMCGIVFPLQKILVQQYSPFYAVTLRFVVTAIAISPFLRSPKDQFWQLVQAALFFMVVPFASHGYALKAIDSGVTAMSTQITPIVLIIWGVVFYKETINRLQIFGIILAFLGVALITLSPEISHMPLLPVLALILSIISYTAGTLILRKIKLKASQVMLWGYLLASFPLIILTSGAEENFFSLMKQTTLSSYALALLVGLLSVLGNGLYTYVVAHYPLSTIMPVTLTLPFFAVISGHLILGENLHTKAILGGLLVFIGVVIVMTKGTKKRLKEAPR